MKKYKSLFLSDIHLGSLHTKREILFDLLENSEFEYLFLVGDIITQNADINSADIEKFKKIINSKNCKIIYILGNHEKERKQPFIELSLNKPLKTYQDYIYKREKDSIYLTHGDSFHKKDIFNRILKFTLSKIKKIAQALVKKREDHSHSASTIYHKKIKPLAQKYLHKSYIKYITLEAAKQNCKISICGHIHLPEKINTPYALYLNCGDWINHASYIVEHLNGELELICQDNSYCQ